MVVFGERRNTVHVAAAGGLAVQVGAAVRLAGRSPGWAAVLVLVALVTVALWLRWARRPPALLHIDAELVTLRRGGQELVRWERSATTSELILAGGGPNKAPWLTRHGDERRIMLTMFRLQPILEALRQHGWTVVTSSGQRV